MRLPYISWTFGLRSSRWVPSGCYPSAGRLELTGVSDQDDIENTSVGFAEGHAHAPAEILAVGDDHLLATISNWLPSTITVSGLFFHAIRARADVIVKAAAPSRFEPVLTR